MLDRRVDRPSAKAAGAAAVFAVSLVAVAILVVSRTHTYWQQTDAIVYRDAGRSLWHHPGQLYRRDFGPARLPFTYPPFAAALFAAPATLPFLAWQIGLAALGVAGLLLAARSALRVAGIATACAAGVR